MNADAVKIAARTRRFDVEFAEVLDAPLAVVAGDRRERPSARSWVATALALLGALITVAVAWQQHLAATELQQPDALEPPLVAGRLCKASPTVNGRDWDPPPRAANVAVKSGSTLATDLSVFEPYTELQSLVLHGASEWEPDGLRPLQRLPRLEVLGLPVGEAFRSENFGVVARMSALRFLTLHMKRALQRPDVDELARSRSLVSLRLIGGSIDADVMAHLAALPSLRALELVALDDCSEDALVALRSLRGLRRLDLRLLGDVPQPSPFDRAVDDTWSPRNGAPRSAGLTPRVAGALAELPELRAVRLTAVECTADAIAALPTKLEHVAVLDSPQLGPEVFDALARFTDLRRLDLDRADRETRWPGSHSANIEAEIERVIAAAAPREQVWEAQARLLAKLRVRELHYRCAIPAAVRAALPKSPLVVLSLCEAPLADLAVIGEQPALRTVALEDCRLQIGDLRPFRELPNLRQLCLRFAMRPDPELDVAAVRELLPNVTVTTHGF